MLIGVQSMNFVVTTSVHMDYLIELEESDEDLGKYSSIPFMLGPNH